MIRRDSLEFLAAFAIGTALGAGAALLLAVQRRGRTAAAGQRSSVSAPWPEHGASRRRGAASDVDPGREAARLIREASGEAVRTALRRLRRRRTATRVPAHGGATRA